MVIGKDSHSVHEPSFARVRDGAASMAQSGRETNAATCARERSPSFWKTRVRWVSIVFSLRKRRAPISRLVRPSATTQG